MPHLSISTQLRSGLNIEWQLLLKGLKFRFKLTLCDKNIRLFNVIETLGATHLLNQHFNQPLGQALQTHKEIKHLRNEFNFWNVHGIMNTSGLLQS